jgi:hypothetical protein
MAGLDPAIQISMTSLDAEHCLDGRLKGGHDDLGEVI